jgi:hypothetical protein
MPTRVSTGLSHAARISTGSSHTGTRLGTSRDHGLAVVRNLEINSHKEKGDILCLSLDFL